MKRLNVGDKVRVSPIETSCPWEGELVGEVVAIETYGNIAVEFKDREQLGHKCVIGGSGRRGVRNGWWFIAEEVELIK